MPAKKARKAAKGSNLRKLAAAKLVDRRHLAAKHRRLLEKLSPEEVDALISVKRKLRHKGNLHGHYEGVLF